MTPNPSIHEERPLAAVERELLNLYDLDETAGLEEEAPLQDASISDRARYEDEHPIASGALKTVCRVLDRKTRRCVALARLHEDATPELYAPFLREAQVTALLEHPNIIAVHDIGVDGEGRPYFTMELKAGDSLVATISMPKGLVLQAQLRNKIERGGGDGSPIRTAAVLTCVGEPQPPDAFRPSYCDRQAKIYLSRNLKRELLPTAAATKSTPKIGLYVRFTQRPWLATGFFGFDGPVENMPQYALEYGRVAGISALLLCTDLVPCIVGPFAAKL